MKERNRIGLWNGVRVALRYAIPIHAMPKDHDTHRRDLRYVYEMAHVHCYAEGESVWLRLNLVDGVEDALASVRRTVQARKIELAVARH